MKLKTINMKTTVPNKETKKSNSSSSAESVMTSSVVTTVSMKDHPKIMSWEKELENIEKMLTNNSSSIAKKRPDFNPESELKLLEKKVIILLKLKQWKEVTEEGYKILGKKGPNVTIYKCILVSLCRLEKFEDDTIELLDHWKKATPKCIQMLETKRIMDGYLSAIRSGVNANILLQNIEDVLRINSDLILSSNTKITTEQSWRFRSPPSRHNTFSLCPRITSGISCIYGESCLFAHSKEELKEWQLRVPLANKIIPAAEGILHSSSIHQNSTMPVSFVKKEQIPPAYRLLPPACMYYLLGLVKKIQEVGNLSTFLVDSLPDVRVKFSSPLAINKSIGSESPFCHKWTFMVASRHPLATVTLLKDDTRENFGITGAFFFNAKRESLDLIEMHPNNKCQKGIQILNTFIRPELFLPFNNGWPEWCCYQIDVVFQTMKNLPSVYEQTMIFDFKSDPKLVKSLSVTIGSESLNSNVSIASDTNAVSTLKNQCQIKEEDLNDESSSESYSITDDSNSVSDEDENEVEVENEPLRPENSTSSRCEEVDSDAGLLLRQWVNQSHIDSHAETQLLAYLDQPPKKDNYVLWMNRFVISEIKQRQHELMKLSVKSDIHIFHSSASGLNAPIGLFGKLFLKKDVNEDSKVGRLILTSCQTISIGEVGHSAVAKPRTYLCRVINKTEQAIVILIGRKAVEELNLSHGSTKKFDIWLHLEHSYLDLLSSVLQGLTDHHLAFLFPAFPAKEPWNVFSLLSDSNKRLYELDSTLNNKQKEAMHAIVSNFNLPAVGNFSDISVPITITGPPGSGKSYLIARTIMAMTNLKNVSKHVNRILICTYSNEAADTFVSQDLHNWLAQNSFFIDEPILLRIYQADHSVQSITKIVKQHCLLVNDGTSFRYPTLDEVLAHKIIIVTVSTCLELLQLGVPDNTFSHIFIDEAERMLELETLCPLLLGGKSTKIILAGDTKILDPELFVVQSLSKMKQFTLLERLFDLYPAKHPFCIRLEETYGIHKEIIQFVSNEFYGSSLKCISSQPSHPKYYPLSFSIVPSGEAVQPDHGEGYYNMREIYEIRDRLIELIRAWPPSWGSPKDHSIAVITAYSDQALGLRIKLKLEGLSFVDVETLPNVLTKKYRVVFISTVRTFRNENLFDIKESNTEFGFFTNRKAIHTAITRAQSLFMVVGDLVSLCNAGPCRDIWREYVSICGKNNSILGLSNLSNPENVVQSEASSHKIQNSSSACNLQQDIPSVSNANLSIQLDPSTALSQMTMRTGDESFKAIENTAQSNNFDRNFKNSVTTNEKEINSKNVDVISISNKNLSSIWNSPDPPPALKKTNSTIASRDDCIWNTSQNSTNIGSLGSSIWSTNISNSEIQEQAIQIDDNEGIPYKNAFDLPDVRLMAEATLETRGTKDINGFTSPPKSVPVVATVSPYRSVLQQQTLFNYHMTGFNGSPSSLAVARPTPNLSWPNNPSNIIRPFVNQEFLQSFNGIQAAQIARANYAFYHDLRFAYNPPPPPTPPRLLTNYRPILKSNTNENFNSLFSKEPSKDFDFFAELDLQSHHQTNGKQQCSSPSSLSSSSRGSNDPINEDSKFILDSKTEFPTLSNLAGWIEVKSSKKSKSPPQQQQKKHRKKKTKVNSTNDEPKKELTVEQKIENLKEMGFEKRQAIKALQVCDRDLQRAVEWLIQYVPHKRE